MSSGLTSHGTILKSVSKVWKEVCRNDVDICGLSGTLNYFQASLIATVGAVGFYFVMVMGMFDFSIGANIMLSAIVGCVFATRFNLGYFGLIVGCILTGTIVGALNGMFYVKLRIPSMIVTTGLALIYESLANYIAGGVEQTLPSNLRAF